jgi:hypothetical protein
MWKGSTLVVAALALATQPARAKVYVNDPLTADSFAGRGSKGGKFTMTGWVPANEPDAVWWEIGDALVEGSVEYTVQGLSLASLGGADHDIFVLYQAPTGKAEPIPYSPWFRNNDFKVMTRIFGVQEQGRPGAMKLEVAMCPRGDPWHHDTACPAMCDGSGIAYAGTACTTCPRRQVTPRRRRGCSWCRTRPHGSRRWRRRRPRDERVDGGPGDGHRWCDGRGRRRREEGWRIDGGGFRM